MLHSAGFCFGGGDALSKYSLSNSDVEGENVYRPGVFCRSISDDILNVLELLEILFSQQVCLAQTTRYTALCSVRLGLNLQNLTWIGYGKIIEEMFREATVFFDQGGSQCLEKLDFLRLCYWW